jgi:DNA-binding GntR family transcriptional regulator
LWGAAKIESTIARASLVDDVATRVREEILDGALKPGTRISVAGLSSRLGVSHIPVREAIRRLEAEGLVETQPHRGPVVATVDLDELHHIYDLRRALETHLIRAAATRYLPEQLKEINHLLDWLLECDPKEGDEFYKAHHAFHHALLEPALNPWAERIHGLLWQSAERYQRMYAIAYGSVTAGHREHRRLAKAAEERDGETLAKTLTAHLDRTERAVAAGYRESHPADLSDR